MEATLQAMLEMGLGQSQGQGQAVQDSDDDGIAFEGKFRKYVVSVSESHKVLQFQTTVTQLLIFK